MTTAMRRVPVRTVVLAQLNEQGISSELSSDAIQVATEACRGVNRAGRQYNGKAGRVAI